MNTKDDQLPVWFTINEELMWSLIGMALASLSKVSFSDTDIEAHGRLAVLHYAGCLESGIEANKRGKHSAAMCLVRQSVEALTIAEISLQKPEFAIPLLKDWKSGKKSHGNLRAELEKNVWPLYGKGLWNESWAFFYKNLSRSIQPYAHYTTELQGWQLQVIDYDGGTKSTVMAGLETYDALKATRITLFHALITWMLGRVLIAHGENQDVLDNQHKIISLGREIAKSKLLFKSSDWWKQLTPDVYFKPGHDWRDVT